MMITTTPPPTMMMIVLPLVLNREHTTLVEISHQVMGLVQYSMGGGQSFPSSRTTENQRITDYDVLTKTTTINLVVAELAPRTVEGTTISIMHPTPSNNNRRRSRTSSSFIHCRCCRPKQPPPRGRKHFLWVSSILVIFIIVAVVVTIVFVLLPQQQDDVISNPEPTAPWPTKTPTTTPARNNPLFSLDLFIRDRYRASDGAIACDFCEERDGCFLDSRAFYIENECRSRGESLNSIYKRLEDSPDVVCRQDFRDDDTRCDIRFTNFPVFDITDVTECDASWTVITCSYEYSIQMSVLEGWFVESDVPVVEFVIPMTTVIVYGDMDACSSGSGDFATSWYPTDESLCMSASVDDGSTTVHGSQMFYCDGNTFNSKRFVDQECIEPSSGPREFLDGVSDYCIDNPRGGGRVIADCNTPCFYCKDLCSTDFGTKIVTP